MNLKKLSLLNPYRKINPYIQTHTSKTVINIKPKVFIMKLKDGILLMLASLVLGWLTSMVLFAKPQTPQRIVPTIITDTVNDVKGKKALFIGDSHTANYGYGWQTQLSQSTGLIQKNISVVGKTTSWMLTQAQLQVNPNYDYCFIYGGANDMYNNNISAFSAFNNIQSIVNLCNLKGVKPIVLTGFDYSICTRTENKLYPVKGAELQRMLLGQIRNAKVVDTRVVYRADCGDGLCHMNYSGHRKTADAVILACKFKRY
jgi:hypothetical protein